MPLLEVRTLELHITPPTAAAPNAAGGATPGVEGSLAPAEG